MGHASMQMFDRMMGELLTHKQLIIVGLAITGLAFYTGVPSNMAAFAEHDDSGYFWFFTDSFDPIINDVIFDEVSVVSERFTDTFDPRNDPPKTPDSLLWNLAALR